MAPPAAERRAGVLIGYGGPELFGALVLAARRAIAAKSPTPRLLIALSVSPWLSRCCRWFRQRSGQGGMDRATDATRRPAVAGRLGAPDRTPSLGGRRGLDRRVLAALVVVAATSSSGTASVHWAPEPALHAAQWN